MTVWTETHLLTILLAVPLLGAFLVLFTPRQSVEMIRRGSVALMSLEFALSLLLLKGWTANAGYQFAEHVPWVPSLGIQYSVGVDGISLWLILLTTFVTPLALHTGWSSVQTKVKEFALAFLLLEATVVGAFIALDLFLFYVFWELMLVPMLLIVGIWGGQRRVYAAVKFFIYTMAGSLLMLVAILYLAVQYKTLSGSYSFDLRELNRLVLTQREQYFLYAAFALAFAIKVPMFPFHTWLPDAHVEAPTAGSMILAAVLLKLGAYGFIRFALPLFPWAAHHTAPTLIVFAVVGIIYGAYCAWVQSDVKKLVAYSSVSHLGFVMVGVFAMNETGITGAVLQMVSHGISTGALFLLVGVIYERRHTRALDDFGGLAKVMPLYTVIFVIVTMSSVGLPGTNGFVGEFMILVGAFLSEGLSYPKVAASFAAIGVILGAVYMLHLVLRMFWGPLDHEENKKLHDVGRRELCLLAPFVVFIFWIGLYPSPFLNRMGPSVDSMVTAFHAKLLHSRYDERRLLNHVPSVIGQGDQPSGGPTADDFGDERQEHVRRLTAQYRGAVTDPAAVRSHVGFTANAARHTGEEDE